LRQKRKEEKVVSFGVGRANFELKEGLPGGELHPDSSELASMFLDSRTPV